MSEYTLLLNSCDKHSETWGPFFELLKRMWPEQMAPVVLNMETKSFSCEGVDIRVVNNPKARSWSDRLSKVLDEITTPYVLAFLEDFFLEEPVDVLAFQECLSYMKCNEDVGCISFHNTPDGRETSHELSGYACLGKKARYRVNCQIGLWRTDVLKKILRSHETAWEFETWGSYRSGWLPFRFYSIVIGVPEPFVHDLGKPIYRGHWNMESVDRIQAKTGVKISTNDLPHIENMSKLPKNKQKKTLGSFFRRLRSVF